MPKRRASGPRAIPTSSPIVSIPKRRAALIARSSIRSAAGGRPAIASSSPPLGQRLIRFAPKRASAWAAPVVPATAIRALNPSLEQKRRMRSHIRRSPPNRWATPARSSHRPSGPESAARGVQRRAANRPRRVRKAASSSGSAKRMSSSGTSARACVTAIPGWRPSDCASGQAAAIAIRWPERCWVTKGRRSGGVPRRPLPSIRRSRSMGRSGRQSEATRFICALHDPW